MTESITKYSVNPLALTWNNDQIEIIKQQIAKGASDAQLALFAQVCQRTGLDPFSRQIYCIMRGGNPTIQVSIDGFRTIAARSGLYGGSHTEWCGDDGIWRDVWLGNGAPAAAKTTVHRIGSPYPFVAVARYSSYQQSNNQLWRSMPDSMVAKVSESLALRKAFPAELSGLYTVEEFPPKPIAPEPIVPNPISERKEAVMDAFQALDWGIDEQKEWAAKFNDKPSKSWTLGNWDAALVDLQDHINRQAAIEDDGGIDVDRQAYAKLIN